METRRHRVGYARKEALACSSSRQDFEMRRPELEELFMIWQVKLLHPLDMERWTEVFQSTVKSLLAAKPLQSLSKTGRLAVVMCIVGSGQVGLLSPTVLAVLACDWIDEWESCKLLQDTVRQASLSCIRHECGMSGGTPPASWSQEEIADFIETGVEHAVAGSWRALGLTGAARESVEKAGRQLRGLGARCRGATDAAAARKLLLVYLDSNRIEGYVQALVSWGQGKVAESGETIFEKAFPFLEARQVQASCLRAEQTRVGFARSNGANETEASTQPRLPSSSAASLQGFEMHSRPKRQRTLLSWASVDDVSPLPSPSWSSKAVPVPEPQDEIWNDADVHEVDGVPAVAAGGKRAGGTTCAGQLIERTNQTCPDHFEGAHDQDRSAADLAEGKTIEPSGGLLAGAGKANALFRAGHETQHELVGRQAEQHEKNRKGTQPKVPPNYRAYSKEDEDDMDTDEELTQGARCLAWGVEKVERRAENSDVNRHREQLEQCKPREDHRASPPPQKTQGNCEEKHVLRQSLPTTPQSTVDMERIALDSGENILSPPSKEGGNAAVEETETALVNEDSAHSVVGSPLGTVPSGRQRVYGNGGLMGLAQSMKTWFCQRRPGYEKHASIGSDSSEGSA